MRVPEDYTMQLDSCEEWEGILRPFVDADDESPEDKAKVAQKLVVYSRTNQLKLKLEQSSSELGLKKLSSG